MNKPDLRDMRLENAALEELKKKNLPYHLTLEIRAENLDEVFRILERISIHLQEGDETATVGGGKGRYTYRMERIEN